MTYELIGQYATVILAVVTLGHMAFIYLHPKVRLVWQHSIELHRSLVPWMIGSVWLSMWTLEHWWPVVAPLMIVFEVVSLRIIRSVLRADPNEQFEAMSPAEAACRAVRETPIGGGRTVWDLLTDERSRRAVEIAERYVAGEATAEQLSVAARDAADTAWNSADVSLDAAAAAAWAAAEAAVAARAATDLRDPR